MTSPSPAPPDSSSRPDIDPSKAFLRLLTAADDHELANLAWRVWLDTYPPIVGLGQTLYMLGRAYTAPALASARLYRSEEFWGVYLPLAGASSGRGILAGFVSTRISTDGARSWLVLPKVYIERTWQGMGLGRRLIEHAAEIARARGLGQMRLNVNRGNPAVHFYQKTGFAPLYEVDLPYGPYWLNDYVMGYDITKGF